MNRMEKEVLLAFLRQIRSQYTEYIDDQFEEEAARYQILLNFLNEHITQLEHEQQPLTERITDAVR